MLRDAYRSVSRMRYRYNGRVLIKRIYYVTLIIKGFNCSFSPDFHVQGGETRVFVYNYAVITCNLTLVKESFPTTIRCSSINTTYIVISYYY